MMMTVWNTVELRNLCSRLSRGKNIAAKDISEIGPYPVYGGNGIRGYTDTYNFDGECAIIGRQGAKCGNVRYFKGRAYMTEHAVVTCANDENNTRFLAYLLGTMQLGRLSGQSAQPGLSVKTLGIQEVNVPDLLTQRQISCLLGEFDDLIEHNKVVNKNLEEQLGTIYHQIFDKETEFTELGSMINTTSGGTPSRKRDDFYENADICWIKSKELSGGYIIDTEEKINDLAIQKSSAKMLPSHSILIAMYGATVGESAIIAKPMTCNQAICALIPNESCPYPYLYQVAKEAKSELINMAVGSAQQNISQVLIKQLKIHSNVESIKKFCFIAKPIHDRLESLCTESVVLADLRDTLLPRLMSGEIDVSKIEV